MSGWIETLVVLFSFSGSLGLNGFAPPDRELGLGLASMTSTAQLGSLSLQLSAEAEWDLHDATLMPLDVALVQNVAPLSWLSLYGAVATNVTVERSGVQTQQTSVGFAAALRAGANAQLTDRLSVGLSLEYAVPIQPSPTPEMIVELGPSFSF